MQHPTNCINTQNPKTMSNYLKNMVTIESCNQTINEVEQWYTNALARQDANAIQRYGRLLERLLDRHAELSGIDLSEIGEVKIR